MPFVDFAAMTSPLKALSINVFAGNTCEYNTYLANVHDIR